MLTRITHAVQRSIFNYQNSYPLTLHYTSKHNCKNESIYSKVTVYVKPQRQEENEHAEMTELLQKWYKLICKNVTYQLKLTIVLTLDYIKIKSRTKIKGSKTVILWWNVTLNNRKIKIKGSGNVTVNQQPGFVRIFKKYSQ